MKFLALILARSGNKSIKNIKLSKNKNTIAHPQPKWLKTKLKEYFMDNIRSKNFKDIGIFDQNYILNKFENFVNEKIPDTRF